VWLTGWNGVNSHCMRSAVEVSLRLILRRSQSGVSKDGVGSGCGQKADPFIPAEAGIQFLAKALGPRFRGDEREM
jgi:hypothetical protein